jgi:hypothetical protein
MTASLLLPADDLERLANFTAGTVVFAIIVLAQLVLFIVALVSILGSKRYTGGAKFLFVVLVFCFPLIGPLGWFLAVRNARIRTDAP